MLAFVLLFVILAAGCDSSSAKNNRTLEQAVYESLFIRAQDVTDIKLYIAKATDSKWFKNNPITKVKKEDLAKLGGISADLVSELYEINKSPQDLIWIPDRIDAILLPSHFSNITANTIEKMCFIDKRDTNIADFALKKQLRAYYTVSKIAFSKDKKIALLKYGYHCSPRSGSGDWLVTLKFKDDDWQMLGGIKNVI